MDKFPPDQKIVKQGKKKDFKAPKSKTPRNKPSEPEGYKPSQGDLGILPRQGSDIPRMAKAPTRSGDGMSNHVGKIGSVLKKFGMLG